MVGPKEDVGMEMEMENNSFTTLPEVGPQVPHRIGASSADAHLLNATMQQADSWPQYEEISSHRGSELDDVIAKPWGTSTGSIAIRSSMSGCSRSNRVTRSRWRRWSARRCRTTPSTAALVPLASSRSDVVSRQRSPLPSRSRDGAFYAVLSLATSCVGWPDAVDPTGIYFTIVNATARAGCSERTQDRAGPRAERHPGHPVFRAHGRLNV